MLFPVSGVEVNPLIPPLVALAVSTFTSMGGVSGAFLLLPFQVSILNFTSPAVSPTNLVFNIVAIPSGVYRYFREGRMNWPVAWVTILGTLPGLLFGALIRVNWLPDPRHFKLFVGCVLLYIGGRLLYDQTPGAKRKKAKIQEFEAKVQQRLAQVLKEAGHHVGQALPEAARVRTAAWSWRSVSYTFLGETFTFNAPALFTLALVVGLIGGTYGIGGGAIIAPFLAAIFQLPIYTIAGAALLGTLVTSVVGVGVYYGLAPFCPGQVVVPDLLLGALFGLGGVGGMYLGARLQRYVSGLNLRLGLGLIISGLALRYIVGFFVG
ncbi:MAG: sulfite exporter TauE/SafE family protein [Deltaproteobacteria bacterium]|nr:sulfite exporter TauE/SafE family protein [Deltaproteobacteria bacterium]